MFAAALHGASSAGILLTGSLLHCLYYFWRALNHDHQSAHACVCACACARQLCVPFSVSVSCSCHVDLCCNRTLCGYWCHERLTTCENCTQCNTDAILDMLAGCAKVCASHSRSSLSAFRGLLPFFKLSIYSLYSLRRVQYIHVIMRNKRKTVQIRINMSR